MIRLTRPFTRRALLGSALRLGSGLTLMSPLPAGAGHRHDRGIGGTGVIIEQPPEDRGIGGTGVIGTIREFGSIIVNEMHIAYPADAEVEIDGRRASPSELRLGHIVQVVAEPDAAGFATQRITIANEVVGPIESVEKGALTVLGQRVLTTYIGDKGWSKGDWIAVSGLRNFDGAIVASLAQYSDGTVARVTGPVRLAADGAPRIGGLALANLDPALAGRRVLAEVGRDRGVAVAVKTVVDPELAAMPGVRQLSIETYVTRSQGAAHFGSGIVVSTRSGSSPNSPSPSTVSLSAQPPVRAIVAVAVNPDDGSMTATGQKTAPAPKPAQPNLEPPKPTESGHGQLGKNKAATPAEKNKAPVGKPVEGTTPGKNVVKPASAESKSAAPKVEAPKPAPVHAAPPPAPHVAPPPPHVAPPPPPPPPHFTPPPPPPHIEPPHYYEPPNIHRK
jgi:hypothetical protein